MRTTVRAVSSGFVLAVAIIGVSGRRAAAQERHVLRGSDVAVYNLVGSITLEAASGSDVEVEVTRRGPDASQLRVEAGSVRGREALRVLYPADRIVFRDESRGNRWFGDSRTSLSVNDDGTFGDGSGRGDRRVEIRTSGSGLEAHADVRVRLPRNGRIAIHLGAGHAAVTNVEGDIVVDVGAASVTTRGTRGRLFLDTGSGDVSVTDAVGEVTLDSGSGEVEMSGVRGELIELDTGSGSVRASDVSARVLRVDTGSGRVALRGVSSPDIRLDTGSGSVELLLTSDVEQLSIDSGSGGITLGVPESLGAMLSVETGSGGVDFDFPVTVTQRGRGRVTGQIGDGRGRIDIETGSGSVRFRRP
ncbi:MAG TPA: DUF4097 family beta strand repeat-containing protein [Gemmatimonadaceae bacterium]|nr:DUF4097 family beta strand repeat-containing protein [Gemmatimonadaceae bacterium]